MIEIVLIPVSNTTCLLLISVGLTVVFRVIPAVLWPALLSDAGYHMLMRRDIRENGCRVPPRLKSCLYDERVTYPWLYHQLLSIIPEHWLIRIPALSSATIDGIHALLSFAGGWWLASELGYPQLAGWAGFWSALFFGVNPALLAHGMGPRAYEVTPRPLGELFFSLSMLSALWAIFGGGWIGWLISVISGGALLLTSKFAAQVLLFFVLLLALVPGLVAVLWMLPGAFLSAMLLSRGRYGHILTGQIAHLRYYGRKMQYDNGMVGGRNQWRDLHAVWHTAQRSGFFSRDVLRALAHLYAVNTYLLSFLRGPVFILLLVMIPLLARVGILELPGRMAFGLLGWSVVWLIPFLVTSTRHFRFLGEAERYAEYSICPAAILVGTGLVLVPLSLPVMLALTLYILCLVGIVGQAWIIQSKIAAKSNVDREELVDVLSRLPGDSTLLGIPAMQVLAPISFRLPHRYADITTDGFAFVWIIENLYEGYPWPKPDWEMWRMHGVDYVVTFSPEYLRIRRPGLPYDHIPLKLIYSNPSYCVYAY